MRKSKNLATQKICLKTNQTTRRSQDVVPPYETKRHLREAVVAEVQEKSQALKLEVVVVTYNKLTMMTI